MLCVSFLQYAPALYTAVFSVFHFCTLLPLCSVFSSYSMFLLRIPLLFVSIPLMRYSIHTFPVCWTIFSNSITCTLTFSSVFHQWDTVYIPSQYAEQYFQNFHNHHANFPTNHYPSPLLPWPPLLPLHHFSLASEAGWQVYNCWAKLGEAGRGGEGEMVAKPNGDLFRILVSSILEETEAGHYSYKAISSLCVLMRRPQIPRECVRAIWGGGSPPPPNPTVVICCWSEWAEVCPGWQQI